MFSYVLTGFLQNDSLEKHFGVYLLVRFSLCSQCVSLNQDESFSLECEDSDLIHIHIEERGGLMYPSDEVMNAVITEWKILFKIGQSSYLMRQFVTSASKTIHTQLSFLSIEFESFDSGDLSVSDIKHHYFLISTKYSVASNCVLKE